MRNSILALSAVLLILSASSGGCSSGSDKSAMKSSDSKSSAQLYDKKWMIQDLEGKRVVLPEGGSEMFMQISADGKASGMTGCNNFTGTAKLSGGKITFSPLATTRKMCPEQIMNYEKSFLDAIQKTASYSISGSTLTFKDASGSALATFVSARTMGQ